MTRGMKRAARTVLVLIAATFGLLLALMAHAQVKKPHNQVMLERAHYWLPMIELHTFNYWPDMPGPRNIILAQIEKESHWNPKAQLKTSRELGRGFGQLTITDRFNAYEEVKQLQPALRDWDYATDPFNPAKQVIGILAKNKANHKLCTKIMSGSWHIWACTMSAYNGGYGGVLADRRVCSNTRGCEPTQWWNNVATTSLKQKVAQPGYGKPFFQINREYVDNTLFGYRAKYAFFFGG